MSHATQFVAAVRMLSGIQICCYERQSGERILVVHRTVTARATQREFQRPADFDLER